MCEVTDDRYDFVTVGPSLLRSVLASEVALLWRMLVILSALKGSFFMVRTRKVPDSDIGIGAYSFLGYQRSRLTRVTEIYSKS
jgi:hypothetical protein